MTAKREQQIIKTRDDPYPVRLSYVTGQSQPTSPFKLDPETECSWANTAGRIGPSTLRPRIEPWLTALVQSEHLSLLVGSGLTHAVHQIATDEPATGMETVTFGACDDLIAAEVERLAEARGRPSGNFEDQLRAANELLRGLQILTAQPTIREGLTELLASLDSGIKEALEFFSTSILRAEYRLLTSKAQKREVAFNYLVNFLMSFASRSGTRERLNLFTTNYDRIIEAGSDIAGLRLIDRFIGSLTPVFRASRLNVDLHYDPPGIRGEPRYLEGVARFTKLHGSVDWIDYDRTIRRVGIPFGASELRPFLGPSNSLTADIQRLMIYPNAAKDRETAAYPYVELFRDLATAICRPNSTLVCYGYGFGDDHINRVIRDMLTIPSTHLVMISYDNPSGEVMKIYSDLGRPAQVTLLIGDHLGDLSTLVDHYLPKPAIDRTTYRMAELLKARWSAVQDGTEVHHEAMSREE